MLPVPEDIRANLIKRATKDCQRDDCRLSERGCQASVMNMLDLYDRNGTKMPDNTTNRMTWSFACSTCGQSLQVTN